MKPIANSHTMPSNTNAIPTGTRGGVAQGRVSVLKGGQSSDQTVIPFSVKWQKELAWAGQHLPMEHPGFVAVAIKTMKAAGESVSSKSVLAHLVAIGRDRKSTDALAAKYARKVAA